MARRSLLSDRIESYVVALAPEDAVARALREETARLPQAGMQIGADQAAFLALLVRACGARRAVEIGTFTGYSALAIARALPADGTLLCCDVSAEWTAIARRYWEKAGVANKIDLRLGRATATLDQILADEGEGGYDFAFIDADKGAYREYFERCLRLTRPNGLIAIDNTLWSGDVADPANTKPDTVALRALNDALHHDERVDIALLPLGDGVTLARKR